MFIPAGMESVDGPTVLGKRDRTCSFTGGKKTEVHVCMWLSHAPPVVIVSYCSVLNWEVQLATLSLYVKVVATYWYLKMTIL